MNLSRTKQRRQELPHTHRVTHIHMHVCICIYSHVWGDICIPAAPLSNCAQHFPQGRLLQHCCQVASAASAVCVAFATAPLGCLDSWLRLASPRLDHLAAWRGLWPLGYRLAHVKNGAGSSYITHVRVHIAIACGVNNVAALKIAVSAADRVHNDNNNNNTQFKTAKTAVSAF